MYNHYQLYKWNFFQSFAIVILNEGIIYSNITNLCARKALSILSLQVLHLVGGGEISFFMEDYWYIDVVWMKTDQAFRITLFSCSLRLFPHKIKQEAKTASNLGTKICWQTWQINSPWAFVLGGHFQTTQTSAKLQNLLRLREAQHVMKSNLESYG